MDTNSVFCDLNQLFENIKSIGKSVGRESIRPALCLYYVLKSPDTPSSDKKSLAIRCGQEAITVIMVFIYG